MRDPRLNNGIDAGSVLAEGQLAKAERLAREIAAKPPDPRALDRAGVPDGTWNHFNEVFLHAVRAGGRQQEWVDSFASDVERAAGFDALVYRSDRERVERLARDWDILRTRDPFDVWDTGDAYFHVRAFPASSAWLLAALDPARFVQTLEVLPQHPGFLIHCLHLTGALDDLGLWHCLVEVAPAVLDEDGKPTGSILLLLLLEELIAHASRIEAALVRRTQSSTSRAQPDGDIGDFFQDELPRLISSGFQRVLDRVDGRDIVIHFFSQMLRDRFIRNHLGSKVPAIAADILSALLASRQVTVTEIQAALRWRRAARDAAEKALTAGHARAHISRRADQVDSHVGEGARTLSGNGITYLIGAAEMVLEHRSTEAELSAVWAWLSEILVGRDEGLSLGQIRENDERAMQVYHHLGIILAKQPDPLSQWLAAYRALEPQRRRAARRHRYEDFDAAEPSVTLLRLGLGATEALATQAPSTACALWGQIERQARRLWLMSHRHAISDTDHTLLLCYAYAPHVLQGRLRAHLQTTWPILGTDPWMTAQSAWYLWKNGVEPPALGALATSLGIDLDRALRDARQWALLTDRKEGFSTDLGDLANALGVTLADERATEPGAANGASAMRAALVGSLPWGASILARLEADNSHLREINMLDTRGMTWALRVELPQDASARLGLGAEIRIIATRGEITGLDLWRAQAVAPGDRGTDPDFIVVASDHIPTLKRLPQTAGPWGQRVPWTPTDGTWGPLEEAIRANQPDFDVFDLRALACGRQLWGREAEIQVLVEHIARGESMAVLGLRKVGKTSLVRAVAQQLDAAWTRERDRSNMPGTTAPSGAEARILWTDAQGVLERTLDGMAAHILDAIEQRNPEVKADALLADGPPPTSVLASVLRKLTDRADAPPLVLVIDEYDLMFEGFDGAAGMTEIEWLFNLIRGLAQEGRRISLVLLGRDPVFLERPMMGAFPNPLLGWVKPLWLGPLTEPAAADLIQSLARRCGFSASEQEVHAAWSWTAGHPLLLRQFGSALRATSRHEAAPTTVAQGHGETVSAFLNRDAVSMIVREVDALLAYRFPAAHALFHSLCNLGVEEAAARWTAEGPMSEARRTLVRFRLVDEKTGRFARVFRAFWSDGSEMVEEVTDAE